MRRAACLLILVALVPVRAEARQAAPSGRDLYLQACAACHGADGRGKPRTIVGFDTPLPNLTECSFTTPEADADWFAVAHSGGPVRAFDRRMPAFGDALSEDELVAIIRHIRTFCTDARWPRGELNLPRALVTGKAFPENEAVWAIGAGGTGHSAVTSTLVYERRIGARDQFEIAVPLDVRETAAGWEKGIGDVALSMKRALLHSLEHGTILSAAGEVILPTGKTDTAGGDVVRFEPYVAVGQLLPHDSFLQFQGGVELSTDRSDAAHEAFWRAAIGRTLFEPHFGRAWSPMFEVLGSRELTSGASTAWDVVPQIQVSLSRRQHVLMNIGVRIPLNDRETRGTQFLSYLLWDWFDGGFFSGWR